MTRLLHSVVVLFAGATLAIAAAELPRIRSEGTFAEGSAFERLRITQRGPEAFELELSSDATTCTYDVTWFRARPAAVIPMIELQAARRGECAASPAARIDGELMLGDPGRGGRIRLLHEGTASALVVDHAWEPAQ